MADVLRAVQQLLLADDFQHRQARRAGEGRAAVGAAESARSGRIHDVRPADHRRQWHAAGHALGDRHEIRLNPGVLDREHTTRAGETRLDLVHDEQDAVLVTQGAQLAQ